MKKIIRLTENDIHRMVMEAVQDINSIKFDENGAYDYPSDMYDVILCTDNDRDCYETLTQLARALVKRFKRGEKLDLVRLTNSSTMKKYQQLCFRKYRELGPDRENKSPIPVNFRKYISQRLISQVESGEWDWTLERK